MVEPTMAERQEATGPSVPGTESAADTLADGARLRHQLARAVAALPDAALDAPVPRGGTESSLGQMLELLGLYQQPRAGIRAILAGLGGGAPAAVRPPSCAPIPRAAA